MLYRIIIMASVLWIYFMYTSYLVNSLTSKEHCPPRNMSATNLYFQIEPRTTVQATTMQLFELNCCMDGYKELKWAFWSLYYGSWQPLPKHYIPDRDNKRTIKIPDPYNGDSSGYFYCIGLDESGNSLNRSIFVYVFSSEINHHLQINFPKNPPKKNYKKSENVTLSCEANTYYPDDEISVYWEYSRYNVHNTKVHTITNSASKFNEQTTIHRKYNGNLFHVLIQTTLTINSLNATDSAQYSCVFTQKSIIRRRHFEIHLKSEKSVSLVLLMTTIGIGALLGTSCLVVWYNFYRVIVFYKTYLDPSPDTLFDDKLQFDVSILHPENDESCVLLARQMCHSLESLNYQCWLMERDKSMGKETRLSIQEVAHKSHLVLIIMSTAALPSTKSSSSFEHPDGVVVLKSLFALQSGLAIKKLYIFNPTYKAFKDSIRKTYFYLSQALHTEIRVQRLCCLPSYQNIDIESISSTSNNSLSLNKACDNYIEWIVASLPTNVIRRVQSCYNSQRIT